VWRKYNISNLVHKYRFLTEKNTYPKINKILLKENNTKELIISLLILWKVDSKNYIILIPYYKNSIKIISEHFSIVHNIEKTNI